MVDSEKIRQKIRFIEDSIAKLEEVKVFSKDDLTTDFIKLAAVKYLLQTAIEAMIDTANHIIARERFESPTSAADAFRVLAARNIISSDNAKIYGLMAKFRNRIVHMYNEVNPDEIYRIIQNNLGDFKSFLNEVLIFIQK